MVHDIDVSNGQNCKNINGPNVLLNQRTSNQLLIYFTGFYFKKQIDLCYD